MNKLFYSVAKYVNDILRNERINLGIAYFYPKDKKIGFIPSSNDSRILSFDDDLTKDELDYLKSSLVYDFSSEGMEFDNPDIITNLLDKSDGSLLEYKTRNYINQIQFETIEPIDIDDNLATTIENLKDIFLYHDRPKRIRDLDKDRIRKLTKQIIQSQMPKGSYTINKLEKNSWNNKPYDFIIHIDMEARYVKSLTFYYVKESVLINQIKLFIYDFDAFIKKSAEPYKKENFIIVINNTLFDKAIEQQAKELLTSQGFVLMTLEEINSFIRTHQQFN